MSLSGWQESRVKRKCNLVLPFAQLLKYLTSGLSEESYAELIILETHEIPLGDVWVN